MSCFLCCHWHCAEFCLECVFFFVVIVQRGLSRNMFLFLLSLCRVVARKLLFLLSLCTEFCLEMCWFYLLSLGRVLSRMCRFICCHCAEFCLEMCCFICCHCAEFCPFASQSHGLCYLFCVERAIRICACCDFVLLFVSSFCLFGCFLFASVLFLFWFILLTRMG